MLMRHMLFLDALCLLPLHNVLPNLWQKEVPWCYLQQWGSITIGLLSDDLVGAGLWQEVALQICVEVNVGR